ncbi:hypothetical protein DMUE_4118 [Dictyocoela muelleri]|nr:hypothetical protein DMUE_4118 [Dictyocoela muelleri]
MTKKLIHESDFNIFGSKEINLKPTEPLKKRSRRVKDEYDLEDDFIELNYNNCNNQFNNCNSEFNNDNKMNNDFDNNNNNKMNNDFDDNNNNKMNNNFNQFKFANYRLECDLKNFFVYAGKLNDNFKILKHKQPRKDVYTMEYTDRLGNTKNNTEKLLLNALLNNKIDIEQINNLKSLTPTIQDKLNSLEEKLKNLKFITKNDHVRVASEVENIEIISDYHYLLIDLLSIRHMLFNNSLPRLHKIIKMAWSKVYPLIPPNIDVMNLHKRVQRFRAIKFDSKDSKEEANSKSSFKDRNKKTKRSELKFKENYKENGQEKYKENKNDKSELIVKINQELKNDNKITDKKITDKKITDNKIIDNKITDNKIIDNKIIDNKITDNKITDNKITDKKITDKKITNNKITDNKITDKKITNNKIIDNKITDNKIIDKKITENKITNNKIIDNKITDKNNNINKNDNIKNDIINTDDNNNIDIFNNDDDLNKADIQENKVINYDHKNSVTNKNEDENTISGANTQFLNDDLNL